MIRMILAEKPDQAREYGKALGNPTLKDGVIIVKDSPYLAGEIHIVAARGHLFEYDYPPFGWKLEELPLIDVELKLALKKDDPDIAKRFKMIKKTAKLADEIIIGTDSDREGERIAYTILSQIPGALNKATKRLWINSMTPQAIRKAMKELKPAHETINFYHEAEARSQSDWLVGFNLSPLATLDLQRKKKLEAKKGNTLSVGRVQTPTLKLICENDRAIEAFVSQPFWKIALKDRHSGTVFTNKKKYLKEAEIEQKISQAPGQAVVSKIEKKQVKQSAPKLFDLTSLQEYGAKKWKKSPEEVLRIAQKLYERKFLTYPRTACTFITQFEFTYLKEYAQQYQERLKLHFPLVNMEPRKQYVNDTKVNEHFAIIPTEVIPRVEQLSEEEQLVYETVTKRTLLMFAQDYIYDSTVVTIEHDGDFYTASGNTVIDKGFTAYTEGKDKEDTLLPEYTEGQTIQVILDKKEDKTKPPTRITEAMLIGKLFPKYHLGTPATRAGIIKTIQKRGYVKKNKKTGEFFPTARGYLLIDYLADNLFANPETTGGWEYFLQQIGEGKLSQEVFVNGIKENIAKQVNEVKNRSN